jgi:hypothetical protein
MGNVSVSGYCALRHNSTMQSPRLITIRLLSGYYYLATLEMKEGKSNIDSSVS